MDEELRAHVELRAEENMKSGMAAEEARYAALRQFGWTESIKEKCREQRGVRWLEDWARDAQFSARQLRKHPGFTLVAVLTLALGIGANMVVFSVAKAVLFRPLGFDAPDRLMWLRLANIQAGTTEDRLSWRDIEDIRESTQSFESLAAFVARSAAWEQDGRVGEFPGLGVTPNLAEVLRIRPALGRMFLPSDAEKSAAPVVLISFELWQARFGGRPDVIGQTLRLTEESPTVVGVLPPGLQFPLERAPAGGTGNSLKAGLQSVWFPLGVHGEDRISRGARMFLPIGRLKPSVTEEAARAELGVLGKRLAADHPETNRDCHFDLVSLRDQVLGKTRQGIPLLAAAVAAVLLICCVNLANLLLARGAARQRELAVRSALGAGRGRIVRALMMESALLAALGGGLGIFLAQVSLRGIRALAAGNVPFIREAAIDGSALAFTAGLAVLAAVAFGLLPSLRLSRVEAAESLRGGTRVTGGPQIRAWQQGLLVAQIALVLMLLTAAGLLLESYRRLMGQDFGYRPQPVITLDLATLNQPTNGDASRFYREIHARLAAVPGVESVGTIQSTPLTGKWTFREKAAVFGRPVPPVEQPGLSATFVAFDYFQAMGIPLLVGRVFQPAELRDDDMPPVVILNEAAAARLFPGESAFGKRVSFGNRPERYYEIIGVVKDTRDVRLEERAEPRFYLNFAFGGAQFAVRSAVPPAAMAPLLREALAQFGNRILIHEIRPMAEIVSSTVAERRFLMALLAAYAAVALGIAGVGIFGVVAYQVARRTGEFGIRLALGSSRAGLVRLVLRQAFRLAAVGVVIGLLASLGAGRLLASQLFELSPRDPWLLGGASLLVLGAALAASALPALRAARVNPLVALRSE